LRIADEEAEHLQNLIDSALEMARLDAADIDMETEISDLGEIVRDVVASMEKAIDKRPLEVLYDANVPRIALDRRLTRLAVKQLLDNALKYSPPDTPVMLRVRSAHDSVSLDVTDHGGGIAAQEQRRIFQRFYRSPSSEKAIPGSGLGLSIAQRVVQAHQGALTVTSKPGETTFRMSFPVNHRGEPI
jgi:signal transduction histidine kinase